MKIMADENIDPALIAWLRARGTDVLSIRESARGLADEQVLELAQLNSRILLTEDKDFGELVFRKGLASSGIIMLRFTTRLRSEQLSLIEQLWPEICLIAPGQF